MNIVESSICDKFGANVDELQTLGSVLVHTTNDRNPRIESLRDAVGDYGIALFAPLLDFSNSDHRPITIRSTQVHESGKSSSSTTISTQAESESDQYRSDDDYDVDTNDSEYDGEIIQQYSFEKVQVEPESMMQIRTCPHILSEQNIQYLQSFLPFAIRDYTWERRFAIGLHGDSFCSLLQKCEGYKNSIVVIRTTTGHILGGYASEEWRICQGDSGGNRSNDMMHRRNKYRSTRHSYYGTGQSYVFGSSIASMNGDINIRNLCVYPWTGQNDYCQICDVDRSILCMGGVGEFGWIVSDNFSVGQTGPCATYNNPPLIVDATFQIADFEIYTLISPIAQFL